MKKALLSITLLLAIVFASSAEKKHLPEAKGLVGIWSLTAILPNGEVVQVGNYKIINPDSTFYILIDWKYKGLERKIDVGLYGTYTITSDSTYIEHIKHEGTMPKLSGSDSFLRYKLLDEDTLLIQYKNEVRGVWIPEIWSRVKPHQTAKKEEDFI